MPAFLFTGAEWQSLFDGLLLSLRIAGLTIAFGLPLGVVLAVLVDARSRLLRAVAVTLVEVGRGVPVLVLLYLVYYGLPQQGLVLAATACGVVALSLNTAAYSAEVFRSAIRAIPGGQREAGLSLGLHPAIVFLRIVLPQAIRVAIPQLLSLSILILQATALCFAIAIPELLSQGYQIGSESFEYMKILVVVALMYASISMPAAALATWLERRLSARIGR